jgi:hypothetical protein
MNEAGVGATPVVRPFIGSIFRPGFLLNFERSAVAPRGSNSFLA